MSKSLEEINRACREKFILDGFFTTRHDLIKYVTNFHEVNNNCYLVSPAFRGYQDICRDYYEYSKKYDCVMQENNYYYSLVSDLPIDEFLGDEIVREKIDAFPEMISMNERIDIDFIRKWKEKLHWKTLSINFKFSESELLEFFGSIHWKSAIYCQEACTKEFIEENELEWIIEDLQKLNFDFMTSMNEEYGSIENQLSITEANRDIILEVLVSRIMSRIGYNKNGELELLFENGDVYLLPEDKLVNMIRDLKIEMLENPDIIDVVRKTADCFGEKI